MLQKKTKIRLRTWATLSITLTIRKIIMLTSIQKSQKTSDSLSNFYIDNWKKNGEVEIGTLHLESYDL